jgi:hypothetical protein
MTPKQLDYIINGAKVFIYRRPDGRAYASLHDYSDFGVDALEVVRVKLDEKSTLESVENDPAVVARTLALSSHHGATHDPV